ncbi:MAG TPA: bifunctional 5,10-methylenetetrahydrofolate dehydrogenase/5,10-methenyltetrahydrofolate cyclohydrolase, partial [Thermoplasmata archaeon]|nr:bifunctional 5,10-methylenetetrahydrofolate dehydrogenase/5,10-methenyltetrahydrofolate cyclohydrolase [Thermoplasmata archaeon]
MQKIDGRRIAEKIEEEIKKRVEGKEIKIVTIVVEGSEESLLFAKLKDKACKRTGIEHEIIGIEHAEQREIEKEIDYLNKDKRVTGINIQLPLPSSINHYEVVKKILIEKDIEGIHPYNMGNLLFSYEDIIPCTPKAVLKIIENEHIFLEGKNVVIVNHSTIIGKPLAILMLNRNATVSVCHIYTKNLSSYTRKADILITATGVKWLIKGDDVKNGCIIIDAGIKKEGEKIYGDVHESALKKARAFTPVPGGVGPVTISCMLENSLIAYK